jgi:hypothetical protein
LAQRFFCVTVPLHHCQSSLIAARLPSPLRNSLRINLLILKYIEYLHINYETFRSFRFGVMPLFP